MIIAIVIDDKVNKTTTSLTNDSISHIQITLDQKSAIANAMIAIYTICVAKPMSQGV